MGFTEVIDPPPVIEDMLFLCDWEQSESRSPPSHDDTIDIGEIPPHENSQVLFRISLKELLQDFRVTSIQLRK